MYTNGSISRVFPQGCVFICPPNVQTAMFCVHRTIVPTKNDRITVVYNTVVLHFEIKNKNIGHKNQSVNFLTSGNFLATLKNNVEKNVLVFVFVANLKKECVDVF